MMVLNKKTHSYTFVVWLLNVLHAKPSQGGVFKMGRVASDLGFWTRTRHQRRDGAAPANCSHGGVLSSVERSNVLEPNPRQLQSVQPHFKFMTTLTPPHVSLQLKYFLLYFMFAESAASET